MSFTLSQHNGYNVTCAGGTDGSIAITATGGIPPYTFNGDMEDASLVNTLAGDYFVRLFDDTGNETDTTITLTQPPAYSVALSTTTFANGHNTACFGCSDGTAEIAGNTNGTHPYTYAWSNGQTGNSIINIQAGTYLVTATDAHGCIAHNTITLTDPAPNAWSKTGNTPDSADFIGTTNSMPLIFKTNGTERLRLAANGNMGLGTSTPAERLDVAGNIRSAGTITFGNDRLLSFTPAAGGSPALLGWGAPASMLSPVMGISYCLSPTPATVNIFPGMMYSYGTNADGGQLNVMRTGFDGANGIIDMAGVSNGDAPNLLIDYYCGKNVYMCTGVNGGNIVMTSAGLGKVGIGTDNPTAKLDVNGNLRVASLAGGGTASMVQADNNGVLSAVPVSATALNFWQSNNSGTDVFHNAGKVGIGTNAPADLLQVGDGTNRLISGGAGAADLNYGTSYIGFNASRSSAGSWTIATDNAHNGGAIMYSDIFGNIYFSTVPTTGTSVQTKTDAEILANSKLFIAADGSVGIGTVNTGGYKFAVNGEVRVKRLVVQTGWSDFVFEKGYCLRTLGDVERYININGHLPDIPSAKYVEANGGDLGDLIKLQMQKIEELTLYIIEQNKRIEALEKEKK